MTNEKFSTPSKVIIFSLFALNLSHCWSRVTWLGMGFVLWKGSWVAGGQAWCEKKRRRNVICEPASSGALQRLRLHLNASFLFACGDRCVLDYILSCSQVVTPDSVEVTQWAHMTRDWRVWESADMFKCLCPSRRIKFLKKTGNWTKRADVKQPWLVDGNKISFQLFW